MRMRLDTAKALGELAWRLQGKPERSALSYYGPILHSFLSCRAVALARTKLLICAMPTVALMLLECLARSGLPLHGQQVHIRSRSASC